MTAVAIPFNRIHLTGREQGYLAEAIGGTKLSGDGPFTRRCSALLERSTGSAHVLLTHSCTAALEMCALLLDLEPGDEVVMPSFTFVSTANAMALRGAVPVFVDVRADTLNIDPQAIEAAITPRTRAIVVVHYAGVGCDLDQIVAVARRHGVAVIEDAAQAIGATRGGRVLGSIGDLGAISFHDTKNVICGEGGALLVNRGDLAYRAEVLREKGTDRSRFMRGEIDKYTWQDVGSSFLPSELLAAFLLAQLEAMDDITGARRAAWARYQERLAPLEAKGLLRRQFVPDDAQPNGHICFVLAAPGIDRDAVLARLRDEGIGATFHYVPLHSAPAGRRLGRAHGSLAVTDDAAARLIRLPLWVGISEAEQARVVDVLGKALEAARPR
jgi:dTDP-4-amino-4,6-dideoxygalactose transaminase